MKKESFHNENIYLFVEFYLNKHFHVINWPLQINNANECSLKSFKKAFHKQ